MIMGADDGSSMLLAEFCTWLDRERGLSPVSVRCYSKQAKYFLAAAGGPEAVRSLDAGGGTAVPLAGAVPAVASWRLSALPCGVKAAEIEMLLAGCDRETAVGLRDYAVLSLLAGSGCAVLRPPGCSSG